MNFCRLVVFLRITVHYKRITVRPHHLENMRAYRSFKLHFKVIRRKTKFLRPHLVQKRPYMPDFICLSYIYLIS